MGFDVKTEVPAQMYEGLIIAYTVKPLLAIPVEWVTEITHVKDKSFFVDEQRKGPYTMWHHEHHFKEVEGGVEMTDIVSYIIPLGFLGKLVEPFLVKPKLEEIFAYRFKIVEEVFG
jgi:ligand-binding SRPBCC domain-containing protein